MKKRVLVCAYYALNTGDDLFLKILFDRYPNVQWDLLTENRKYNEIFKRYKNVKVPITNKEIKIGSKKINLFFKLNYDFLNFKQYDALVNIGGSIFMEDSHWKAKLKEREYLIHKFKKSNKRTYFIGANFGPYKNVEFFHKYKELFEKCDDVCFRDSYSYNLFHDLENVRLAPDVVFNLNNKKAIKIDHKTVGFSLIDIQDRKELKVHYNQYIEKVKLLIEKYSKMKYKVRLFSFCEKEGDLKIINSIFEKLKIKDNIEIINYKGNIDEFLNKFMSCEVIIGTRFHSIILALLNKQRVIPIIYSDKTYNVLRDINKEKNCYYINDFKTLDIEKVYMQSMIADLLDDRIPIKAEKQFEKLDMFLE